MSDSLRPRWLQHTRLPSASQSPGVCSDLCPLSWWCYLTILSSATCFFFCPQSFPASGSSLALRINIGASASASVLPMNIQGWFPLGWTWFDLLAVQGTQHLLQHHSSKASILWHSAFFMVQLSHPYTTARKTIALTTWTFVNKVMSLLFNTLSRFVIAFLSRSKHLLIS